MKRIISLAVSILMIFSFSALSVSAVSPMATALPTLSGTLTGGVLTVTVSGANAATYPQVNIVATNKSTDSPDLDAVTAQPVPTVGTIQVGVDANNTITFTNRKGKDYNVKATLKLANGQDGASLDAIEVTSYIGVTYDAHVQKIAWQPYVNDGALIGTMGKALRIEAVNIKLTGDTPAGAKIIYQAHVQNVGWQTAVSNGAVAGTSGRALRVEALKITLSGLPGYKVQYRGYVQKLGWQPWQTTENNTSIDKARIAGTSGKALRVEALQIKIVKD